MITFSLPVDPFGSECLNINYRIAMESMHFVGEDEEDLYSGFNEYNAPLDTIVCDIGP